MEVVVPGDSWLFGTVLPWRVNWPIESSFLSGVRWGCWWTELKSCYPECTSPNNWWNPGMVSMLELSWLMVALPRLQLGCEVCSWYSALHSVHCTVQFTALCTVCRQCRVCSLQFGWETDILCSTLCSAHCAVPILHSAVPILYSVQLTLCTVQCAAHTLHCTVCRNSVLYSVQSTVHVWHSTLHSVQLTLCIEYCTGCSLLDTLHCEVLSSARDAAHTLRSVTLLQCAVCNSHSALYSVCTVLYSAQAHTLHCSQQLTLYTVQCAQAPFANILSTFQEVWHCCFLLFLLQRCLDKSRAVRPSVSKAKETFARSCLGKVPGGAPSVS